MDRLVLGVTLRPSYHSSALLRAQSASQRRKPVSFQHCTASEGLLLCYVISHYLRSSVPKACFLFITSSIYSSTYSSVSRATGMRFGVHIRPGWHGARDFFFVVMFGIIHGRVGLRRRFGIIRVGCFGSKSRWFGGENYSHSGNDICQMTKESPLTIRTG